MREQPKKSKCLYYRIYIGSYLNYITIIGRKRTSDDADLMQPNQYIVPKNKRAKIPPPEPWELPDFTPLPIDLPYTDGAPNLPPHIDPTDPLALFKLI